MADLRSFLRRSPGGGLFHDGRNYLALFQRIICQVLAFGGHKTFGAVMSFKALGAHNSATHFLFDLEYYVDNPAAAQAMEFYVTQSSGGSPI